MYAEQDGRKEALEKEEKLTSRDRKLNRN